MIDEELRSALRAIADAAPVTLDDAARARVLERVEDEGLELLVDAADDVATEDDPLRAALATFSDGGAPRLDEAARARVLERVEREGPALVRRRPRWPWAAAALAAAAAVALLWPRGPEPPAPVAGPRCAQWRPAEAVPLNGALDLGRRGRLRVDGELAVVAPTGCTTQLELEAGRVDVEANDLGDGVLRVHAGDVFVEVRGTRFVVIREADHVAVEVTEGHVVVRAPGEREIHLRAGERWARGDRTASARPAPAQRLEEVAPAPERAPAPPSARARPRPETPTRPAAEPAPTDRERLVEAERRWRAGEIAAARRIFQRVGAGRGALAEAAWIRLARLELSSGDPARARGAARTQRQRFGRSRLGAEALWIEIDASRRLGDDASVRAATDALRSRYPDSPQARALPDEP